MLIIRTQLRIISISAIYVHWTFKLYRLFEFFFLLSLCSSLACYFFCHNRLVSLCLVCGMHTHTLAHTRKRASHKEWLIRRIFVAIRHIKCMSISINCWHRNGIFVELASRPIDRFDVMANKLHCADRITFRPHWMISIKKKNLIFTRW